MSSNSTKVKSGEKISERYIELRTSGEKIGKKNQSMSDKVTDNTSIEQIIIEKILAFPPEKQKKLLDYAETLEDAEISPETEYQTIWDMVKQFAEDVPDEAWDELPTDGATNVDYYLYGHKKKSK